MGARGIGTNGKQQTCQYLREQKWSDCELPALGLNDIRKDSSVLIYGKGPWHLRDDSVGKMLAMKA